MIIEMNGQNLCFDELECGDICEYCNYPTDKKFIGMKISVDGDYVILNLETYETVDFGLHYIVKRFNGAKLVL